MVLDALYSSRSVVLLRFSLDLAANAYLTEAQLYAGRAVDRDWYLDMVSAVTEPVMAKGYRLRMERHEISFSD